MTRDMLPPIKVVTDTQCAALRATLQARRDAVDLWCVLDRHGRFLRIDGDCERLLGYRPDEMIGRSYADFVVGEDRLHSDAVTHQLLQVAHEQTLHNRYRCRNGSLCHLIWHGLWSPDDELMIVHGRDVSDLIRNSEALREQSRLLSLAGKVAQLGGWSLDLRHNELRWSNEVYDLLERARDSAPLTLEESLLLYSPASRDLIMTTLTRCRAEGGSFDLDLDMVTTRGRHIDVRLAGHCDTNAEGQGQFIVGAIQDVTRNRNAERSVEHLTDFDPLTGLANRKQLIDALTLAGMNSLQKPRQAALLQVNIDDFKSLNHGLGHKTGDRLLSLVGERLRTCARDADLVARTGADNFMVLMRQLDPDLASAEAQVRNIASRIQQRLTEPYRIDDGQHLLTISIGITLSGQPHRPPDELIREAEMALLTAKSRGGNLTCFYDATLLDDVARRLEMSVALRAAVEAEALTLCFEPQITDTGRVVGFETLMRWQPERGKPIPPSQFIPVAEHTGLIVTLGRYALRQACRQLAHWAQDPATDHLTLSVNVSASEFHQPDFVEQVLRILDESGANPQRLTLELTESLLLHNVDTVIERMQTLRAQGVHFALDDFGTGYSSLTYLQQLPLDQLKLDRSFVEKVPGDLRSSEVLRAIIGLGLNLGLGLLAEGVETEAQRQFLLTQGCRCFQGFLFTPTLTAEAMTPWLAQHQAAFNVGVA